MTQLYDPRTEWDQEDAQKAEPRWMVEKILQAIADGSLQVPDRRTWSTTNAQITMHGNAITGAELGAISDLILAGLVTWDKKIVLTQAGDQWLTKLGTLASYTTKAGNRSHREVTV